MIPGMRTLRVLLHTPLVPPPQGPAAMELSTFTSSTTSASVRTSTRPRAGSRTLSNRSLRSGSVSGPGSGSGSGSGSGLGAGSSFMPMSIVDESSSSFPSSSSYLGARRWASDKGRKELYSDEAGSTGAGIDDVAHTDAAFDKNPNPKSASKSIEQETGKDFTQRSPTSENYSNPDASGDASEKPLRTGKSQADK